MHKSVIRRSTIHCATHIPEYGPVCNIAETEEKGKLGANAMKRVAAGAHLPTPWFFKPAKRPDDRADYYMDLNWVVGKNRFDSLQNIVTVFIT